MAGNNPKRRGPGSNQHKDQPPRAAAAPPAAPRTTGQPQVRNDPFTGAPPWPTRAVTELCESESGGRFQRVPKDPAFARQVMDSLVDGECALTLYAASKGNWVKAHTQSYDAARKSIEQLLLTEGWRVSAGGGGHRAVATVVAAWLGKADGPGPRIAKKFAASVNARHMDEYPHPKDRTRTDKELRELALDNIRLMNLARQAQMLEVRPDLVPTDDNLATFRP
jgi:hypothetical protein